MNPFLICFLSIVTLPMAAEDITTMDGKTYKDVTVQKLTTEGPIFLIKGKPQGILFKNLPVEQRFKYQCELAMSTAANGEVVMKKSDAFSIDQLEEAKKKAVAEGKPLGLVLVWDNYFGASVGMMTDRADSALAHFHHVFKDQMVLVFVHHETDMEKVPAPARTFGNPENDHIAPSMSVIDPKAETFICQIPYAHKDGKGREAFFRAGIEKIMAAKDLWALPPAPAGAADGKDAKGKPGKK